MHKNLDVVVSAGPRVRQHWIAGALSESGDTATVISALLHLVPWLHLCLANQLHGRAMAMPMEQLKRLVESGLSICWVGDFDKGTVGVRRPP